MSNDTLAKAKKLFDEELESDFQVLLERWRKHVKGVGIEEKGGPGSGHHGHAGIPGKQGGSLPGTGGSNINPDDYKVLSAPEFVEYRHIYEQLSGTEKDAFTAYKNSYEPMNMYMRHNERHFNFTSDTRMHINELRKAAERTKLPENMQLYRGIKDKALYDKLLSLGIGGEFSDKGFVSTSVSKDTASSFGKYVIRILASEGASGLMTNNFGEWEVVLPPDAKFEILDVSKMMFIKDDVITVVLK